MTTEERLDRLVNIVDSLAASVIHHDDQIEAHDRQLDALIRIAEKHAESTAKVERQRQA